MFTGDRTNPIAALKKDFKDSATLQHDFIQVLHYCSARPLSKTNDDGDPAGFSRSHRLYGNAAAW